MHAQHTRIQTKPFLFYFRVVGWENQGVYRRANACEHVHMAGVSLLLPRSDGKSNGNVADDDGGDERSTTEMLTIMCCWGEKAAHQPILNGDYSAVLCCAGAHNTVHVCMDRIYVVGAIRVRGAHNDDDDKRCV